MQAIFADRYFAIVPSTAPTLEIALEIIALWVDEDQLYEETVGLQDQTIELYEGLHYSIYGLPVTCPEGTTSKIEVDTGTATGYLTFDYELNAFVIDSGLAGMQAVGAHEINVQ